jgi:restriction system protein
MTSNSSDRSDRSDLSDAPGRLLPKHGGYRKLRSFQAAEAVYDATVIFCNRFIAKSSRTHDQMVQAARSGVQNIAEGSMASATSKKTELKLTNVARASLEELLRDCEDYGDLRSASPEAAANTLLCLINQASYLLRRQLGTLEQEFLEHGGFTERMYSARSKRRSEQSDGSDKSDKSDLSDGSNRPAPPACPRCGKPMRLRTARQGSRAGRPFWGCSAYPDCTGTRPADQETAHPTNAADRPRAGGRSQ